MDCGRIGDAKFPGFCGVGDSDADRVWLPDSSRRENAGRTVRGGICRLPQTFVEVGPVHFLLSEIIFPY